MAASLILTLGCARAAGAQFVEFRPPPPAQVPANVPVSIAFGGDAGVDVWCATPDDYYGCQDMYVYPYDYAPPAGDLTFTVNGVSRVHDLTFTGPVDENCVPVGSYGGYYCSRTYTAAGTTQLTAGAQNTLTAALVSYAWASQTVVVAAQTGPAVTLVSPTLYRDPAQCALDCGELVQTYSTPAYVSRDVARSLTLVYRSGRADPRPVVEVDVTSAPAGTDRVGLALVDPSTGAAVPLTHGAAEVVRAYAPGQTLRLAAQFTPTYRDQTDYARPYTVVVTAYAGQTSLGQTTDSARVLIDWANGPQSPYGAGWGVAGVQQWRTQGPRIGDGVVIAEGGGAIGYWACTGVRNGVYTFASPPGDATVVTYDDATGLLSRRYPDGTVATLRGSDGNQVALADRMGNVTTFAYALGGNRLTSVTDPAGQAVTLTYHGAGESWNGFTYRDGSLSYAEDFAGRRSYFLVADATNELRATADPRGGYTTLDYDGAHRLIRGTDPRGGVWDYLYDGFGTLAWATGPAAVGAGGAARPSTDFLSWARAVLPAYGAGSPTSPAAALDPAAARAAAYDNGTGLQTAYRVDRWGAAARVEAPGGVVTTATRDANGNVTQTVGPRGEVTDFVWNAQRPWLLDSTYDVAARVGTAYAYDAANGYAVTQVRVNGRERQAVTYSGGRVASVRVGGTDQPATVYGYAGRPASDPRPASVTDPRGHVTTYAYESGGLGNTRAVTTPTGSSNVVHDAYGRDSVQIDPVGRRTVTTYDVLNRPLTTTDPAGQTTTTAYDALFPRTVTDAVGQVYRDSTNALGAPVQAVDPAGRATQTAYDAAGRVSQVTNRRGQTVTLGYDPQLGYVNSRTTSDGFTATYGADALGRWAAAANAEARDTAYADSLGRDTLAVRRFPALSGLRYLVRSTYDSLGRRTGRTLSREGAGARPFPPQELVYEYGADRGLLQSVGRRFAFGIEDEVRFYYNDEGALVKWRFGSGSLARYDARTAPTALHTLGAQLYLPAASSGSWGDYQNPVNRAFGYHLSYDSLGRVTKRIREGDAVTREYTYDAAGRLAADTLKASAACTPVSAPGQVPGDAPTSYECSGSVLRPNSTARAAYAWDAVGNPVRGDVYILPGQGNRMAWANGQNHSYDADGHLTASDLPPGASPTGAWLTTRRLTWNSLGQFTGVWHNPGAGTGFTDSVTFGYDAGGTRARKINVTRGQTTYYLWDDGNLLAELDGSGDLVAHYAYLPGVPDAPLFATAFDAAGTSRTYYYMREVPGHVVGLLTAGADGGVETVAAQYTQFGYPAFGATAPGPALHGGWVNPLRYGAREYDAETGLSTSAPGTTTPHSGGSCRRTRLGWRGASTGTRTPPTTR